MFKEVPRYCTLLLLSCFFFSFRLFAQQESAFQHALEVLQNNQLDDSTRSETYASLAILYESKNIDSSLWFSSKAIQTALPTGNQGLLARAYLVQADDFTALNQPDTALERYFQVKNIGMSLHANDLLYRCYTGISQLYQTTQTWDKALDYTNQALKITENDSAVGNPADAYSGLGNINMGLNDFQAALVNYQKAKTAFASENDLQKIAHTCLSLGRLYTRLGQYPAAKQQLDSAALIFSSLDLPFASASVDEEYGHIYAGSGQYDSAVYYYNRSLGLYQGGNLNDKAANLFLDLGKMYFIKGQFTDARQWLQQAYTYFKNNDQKENQLQTIVVLAQTDSALGNNQHALSYLLEYKSLSDSLNQEKITLRARQMLIESQVGNKEKENLLLRQENINTKNWWVLTLWGSIVLFITAIALFLLYRRKYQINKEVQVSQQLTTEAYRELSEVSQMKDKLFSILAHDLRSPLANTQHLLQLTKTGAIDSDIFTQLAAELEVNLDYNRELLDNLLSWARSQMNGVVIIPKEIKLRKLVDDNFSLFASTAEKKQVKLLNFIDENCLILADENVVKMALRNTISNAIKFSHPGKSVKISSYTTEGRVFIKIQDEGIGISESAKKNMFTFQTVSTRGTQQEKGAGIGLRITMEMVQKMNGKIWIESEEGVGTTAYLEVLEAR